MKYIISLKGKIYEVDVEHGEAQMVRISDAKPGQPKPVISRAPDQPAAPAPAAAPAPVPAGSGEPVPCPMGGTITSVKVSAGQQVKQGDLLATLEAMKMENEIFAPCDATITQVAVKAGAAVQTGDPLVFLQKKGG